MDNIFLIILCSFKDKTSFKYITIQYLSIANSPCAFKRKQQAFEIEKKNLTESVH